MKSTKKSPAKRKAPKKRKQSPPRTQAEHQEDVLDDALSNSFPASDPISMTEPAPREGERAPQQEPAPGP